MRPRRVWGPLGLVAAVAWTAPVHAQTEASERALRLAYEADDLYARARWDEAYDRFAAADAAAHSPVFVLYMARCRKNASHYLEAQALYARVASEQLRESSPKPFRDAVADAGAERRDLIARTPGVQVVVVGTPEATVRVDGKSLADPRTPLTLDPGPHTVDASSRLGTVHKDVDLRDGAGIVRVELAFAPRPAPHPPEQDAPRWPLVVALSAGVGGLGVGAATGVVAWTKTNSVRSDCVNGHCPTTDAGTLNSARTLATVSTVGFAVAGAAAVTTVVLLLVRPGHGARSNPAAAAVSVGQGLSWSF